MTEIRAIETSYAGCRFRSRLEARWAVFFDRLGIAWDFESQGFHTPAGGYLPDFYLPDAGLYVEIKGPRPSDRELAKCQHIPDLIILVGSVPRNRQGITWWQWNDRCTNGRIHLLHACSTGWETRNWVDEQPWWLSAEFTAREIDEALTAARSARFEHGENGTPRSSR